MRRLSRFALVLLAPLCACAVGPNHRPPSTAAVAPPVFAETASPTSPAPPPARWWRLYDDPALDGLVEEALAANTDLRRAAADLARARGVLEAARAGLFPSTGVAAAGSYSRSATSSGAASSAASSTAASGTAAATGAGFSSGSSATGTSATGAGAAGTSALPSPGSTYSVAFDAVYEVDLFGRIRRGIEAARGDAQAAEAARDYTRTTVAAETTRAYVNACAYAAQAAVARRSLDLVSDSYAITVRRRDLGAASDFDVANAGALREQVRATIAPLEGQRRAALYSLAVLTGRPPEQVPPAAAACAKPPPLVKVLPVGDGAGLLARRPDVREAERTLAADTARIGVATADLYPTVSLSGLISTAGRRLSDLGTRAATGYGVGPLISWDFPNILATRARIRQAGATAEGALASFDGVVLGALQETEQALATYGAELDRNSALRAARDQAAEAARLSGLRVQAGSISPIDLIVIQRTQVDAEAALAASDTTLASDQISVFKALGGGWEEAPPVRRTAVAGTRLAP